MSDLLDSIQIERYKSKNKDVQFIKTTDVLTVPDKKAFEDLYRGKLELESLLSRKTILFRFRMLVHNSLLKKQVPEGCHTGLVIGEVCAEIPEELILKVTNMSSIFDTDQKPIAELFTEVSRDIRTSIMGKYGFIQGSDDLNTVIRYFKPSDSFYIHRFNVDVESKLDSYTDVGILKRVKTRNDVLKQNKLYQNHFTRPYTNRITGFWNNVISS